jgi:hypothetical protein
MKVEVGKMSQQFATLARARAELGVKNFNIIISVDDLRWRKLTTASLFINDSTKEIDTITMQGSFKISMKCS